jgi:hypothetical protein
VTVRALGGAPATPSSPLRLTIAARKGRVARVTYALDGVPLRAAKVAPAQFGRPGAHTVTAMLQGRTGAAQTVALALRTTPCTALFTAKRSRTGLRVRVDARSALTAIDFSVPASLLPRRTRSARPVGTLRLLLAGEGAPRSLGLVLPAKAASLLASPSVRIVRGGLQVSGLPAGTVAVELSFARTAAIDGAAPGGALKLRATVKQAGAKPATYALRTR